MIATKSWRVEVFIGEQDGRTYAEARLHTELGDQLLGIGRAQVGPDDYDVPEIGDEVAVARALGDLGHRVLVTAAADIAQVTDRPARLTH